MHGGFRESETYWTPDCGIVCFFRHVCRAVVVGHSPCYGEEGEQEGEAYPEAGAVGECSKDPEWCLC